MKKSMLYFVSLCFCLGAVALAAQRVKPLGFQLKDTTIVTAGGQTLVVNGVTSRLDLCGGIGIHTC